MRRNPLPKIEPEEGCWYWVRDAEGVNDCGLPMIVAQWRNDLWWACGSARELMTWRIVPLQKIEPFSPKEAKQMSHTFNPDICDQCGKRLGLFCYILDFVREDGEMREAHCCDVACAQTFGKLRLSEGCASNLIPRKQRR